MTLRDDLTTTGFWYFTDGMAAGQAAEFAQWIESLGYSTLWLPDTVGRDPFAHIAWLPGGWSNTWPAMKKHPHYFDVDQLYDLETDPYETTNLAGDPAHAPVLHEMKLRLQGYLQTFSAPLSLHHHREVELLP